MHRSGAYLIARNCARSPLRVCSVFCPYRARSLLVDVSVPLPDRTAASTPLVRSRRTSLNLACGRTAAFTVPHVWCVLSASGPARLTDGPATDATLSRSKPLPPWLPPNSEPTYYSHGARGPSITALASRTRLLAAELPSKSFQHGGSRPRHSTTTETTTTTTNTIGRSGSTNNTNDSLTALVASEWPVQREAAQ